MSGHSHWAKIKWQKTTADAKKSQAFSKMAQMITLAAREGGGDPTTNSKLRLAIEAAKKINLPSDNIERAIKRGTGDLEGVKLEEVIFEAYGPGGSAIIIEGITDNKNRTLNEIKQVLNLNGGKLVGEGAVRWMFERKGCLIVDCKLQVKDLQNKEKLELLAIEAGADDIYWHEDILDVFTKPDDLEKVNKNLEEKGVKIESVSLDWVAKEMIDVNEETKKNCQKLFEALDENEAVQEIYSNLKV